MSAHETKVESAIKAIRAVHADTSVPLLSTKESLTALREEVQALFDALECDLADLED